MTPSFRVGDQVVSTSSFPGMYPNETFTVIRVDVVDRGTVRYVVKDFEGVSRTAMDWQLLPARKETR